MLKGHKKEEMIAVPLNAKNDDKINTELNFGYKFIEKVFDYLDLDTFFADLNYKCQYSLCDIFEFLVYQRILNPSSKRASYQKIDSFFGIKFNFELEDVYRSLDKFSDESIHLQAYLNNQIKNKVGRNQSYSYYDVTNYYFQKDFNGPTGSLCQKGVSKEHQLTPIVQFGLFMDSNNLPIAMKTYPGNTSDSLTLQPAMNDIKNEYNLDRLIVVADKGLNSKANIDYICNNGDGYVVSQVLMGPKGTK